MDCPCAALDTALVALDDMRQQVELLTRRLERLIVQARRQGMILPSAIDADDLFGAIDLAAVLGISRQRIYQLAETHSDFPKQVRPGRWSALQVIEWRKRHKERRNDGAYSVTVVRRHETGANGLRAAGRTGSRPAKRLQLRQ